MFFSKSAKILFLFIQNPLFQQTRFYFQGKSHTKNNNYFPLTLDIIMFLNIHHQTYFY